MPKNDNWRAALQKPNGEVNWFIQEDRYRHPYHGAYQQRREELKDFDEGKQIFQEWKEPLRRLFSRHTIKTLVLECDALYKAPFTPGSDIVELLLGFGVRGRVD